MTAKTKLTLALSLTALLASACSRHKKHDNVQADPIPVVPEEKVADCSKLLGFWNLGMKVNGIETLELHTNIDNETTLTWKGQDLLKLNGEVQAMNYSVNDETAPKYINLSGSCAEDNKLVWTTVDTTKKPEVKHVAGDSMLGEDVTTTSSLRWTLALGEDGETALLTIENVRSITSDDPKTPQAVDSSSEQVQKIYEEVATRVLTPNPVIPGPVPAPN
jgi:hypothetical protein